MSHVVNGIMADVGEMGRAADSEEAGETRFPNAGRSVVSKTMVFGEYSDIVGTLENEQETLSFFFVAEYGTF